MQSQPKETALSQSAKTLVRDLKKQAASSPRGRSQNSDTDLLIRKALAKESLTGADCEAIPALIEKWSRLSIAVRWACKANSVQSTIARVRLVESTCDDIEFLHKLPQKVLIQIAGYMTSFPVMGQAHPTFRRKMDQQLARIELGKHVAPNYRSSAKWKNDIYSEAAGEWLEAFDFYKVDKRSRAQVEAFWRDYILPSLKSDTRCKEWVKGVKTKSDEKSPSRARQRVFQTIKARLFGIIGLR